MWYEYLPGVIMVNEVKNSKDFYPIKTNDFLQYLIHNGVISYPDVWPNYSEKLIKIFKKTKPKSTYWQPGDTNNVSMKKLLIQYIKDKKL